VVGINALVSTIWRFWYLRVWLENPYSRPQNGGFGGI